MSPDELRQVGLALYGTRWPAQLAYRLEVTPLTIRRWVKGKHGMRRSVPFELLNLCKARRTELDLAIAQLGKHTMQLGKRRV